jgi:hypothetical protein
MAYQHSQQDPYSDGNRMNQNGGQYAPVPPPSQTRNNHPYIHNGREASFDSVSDLGGESQETLRHRDDSPNRPESFIGFPRPPLSLSRPNGNRTLSDLHAESPPGTPNYSRPAMKPWGRPESSTTLISPYSAAPSPYVGVYNHD